MAEQKGPFDKIDLGTFHLTHLADQVGAFLLLVAELLGAFYKALIKEGLPEDLAQSLVYEWFIKVIGTSTDDRQE